MKTNLHLKNNLQLIVLLVIIAIVFTYLQSGNSQEEQKKQIKTLETKLAQARIDATQAIELVQQPVWYWVAPGIVSSGTTAADKRIDYNSGVTLGLAEADHVLDRNASYPRKVHFIQNTNNIIESICGGLLVMVDAK